jgi:aminopeptidase
MFDLKEYYAVENRTIRENYNQTVREIQVIFEETRDAEDGDKREFFLFFNHTAKFILKLCRYEEALSVDYFYGRSFEALLTENHELFREILGENYETSYANPAYCVKKFGSQIGPLVSYFYTLYRTYIIYTFSHKRFKMEEYNRLFIEVYRYVQGTGIIDYTRLKKLITSLRMKDKSGEMYYRFNAEYSKDFRYYQDIVEKSDLADLRYLFMYGKYISPNEIKTAKFMLQYPEERLRALAGCIVEAYFRGLAQSGKDITKKSTVGFRYPIGMEKLYRYIYEEFRAHNLEITVRKVYATKLNQQYTFDHKFDNALYLDESYTQMMLTALKNGLERNREILAEYSGALGVKVFGEIPFSPQRKEECLKLSPEQQQTFQKYNNETHQIVDSYIPSSETSFCLVAFPSPEIGEKFAEIFEDIVDINMLDSERYENIQQIIIDVLDRADYVHVKGKGENKTDIRVKMQPLKDPANQTNFDNAGASLNIPVGEVFTAPQLTGTNGVLHVEETYQNFLRYDNLILTFKDGYIVDYSCTNFDSDGDNKKYIEENLLFPHKTLPIGEFAVGTNTTVYAASKRYNIMKVLPALIMEKTGPHFAIGDPCFSRSEDRQKYNQFNKKEVCALENEKSVLRKTNPGQAYTNKHRDITLAFDSIHFIRAVKEHGERVDIIKDGRFVLAGTEELNEPLDKMNISLLGRENREADFHPET